VAGVNDRNVPSDPPRLSPIPTDLERLTGRWYYLGHWMWQFGHFLIETLPVLWAHQGEPLLAHQFGDDGAPSTWQRRLMELAGVSSMPVIVGKPPLRVEHLRVPTRPTVVGGSMAPDAADIWQRVAQAGAGVLDLPVGRVG
jgi:capsular polysaccharide biosynthesis protein